MATAAVVEGLDKAFKPYVLEIALGGSEEDGSSLCLALVVIRKPSGLLLAVPSGFFPEHLLEEGQGAGPMELIGPSHYVVVPGGTLETMDGSPPTAGEEQVDVLLVDMGTGVLELLTPVSDFSGPTEILHLFSEGNPFVYPLTRELTAEAWEWIYRPDSESRVQYYSAGEEAEEEVPEAEGLEEAVPNGPVPPALVMPSAKEADNSLTSLFSGGSGCCLTHTDDSDCTAKPEDEGHGRADCPAKQVVSIEKATWRISYGWIRSCLDACSSQPPEGNATTNSPENYETSGAWCNNGGVGGEGDRAGESRWPGSIRHSKGDACPIYGYYCAGCAACKYERGSPPGAGELIKWVLQQRSQWEDETAAGACTSQGDLLCGCDGKYESEDEPIGVINLDTHAACSPGHDNDKVCRTVRRIWQGQGLWPDHVANSLDHGLSPSRELAGSKGCHGSIGCLPRANITGWCYGCGVAPIIGGGPAVSGVYESIPGPIVPGEVLCAFADQRWVTVALSFIKEFDVITQKRSDLVVGKGAMPTDNPTPKVKPKPQPKKEETWAGGRPGRRCLANCSHRLTPLHGEGTCTCDRCYPKPAKVPGGESRRIGFDASRRRFKLGKTFGRGREISGSFGGNNADEGNGCPQSISFQNLVASMPRWVLFFKTKFAHFFSRSFHIKCGGSAPSTVVFPLPLADFGIFESRGPKLSQRRWRCLLKKRML